MASVAVDPARARSGPVTILEGERLFALVGADRTGGVPSPSPAIG